MISVRAYNEEDFSNFQEVTLTTGAPKISDRAKLKAVNNTNTTINISISNIPRLAAQSEMFMYILASKKPIDIFEKFQRSYSTGKFKFKYRIKPFSILLRCCKTKCKY